MNILHFLFFFKFLIISLLLFVSISCISSSKAILGIELLKGKSRFDFEVSQLRSPKGIVPPDTNVAFPDKNFLVRDTVSWKDRRVNYTSKGYFDGTGWNQFFIYDEDVTLVILSVSPRYFIKIESEKFFYHLEREYNQIQKGLSGIYNDKVVSSYNSINSVGDFDVGLYFTPKELNYSTGSSSNVDRIKQISQSKPKPDLWRFLDAAQEAFIYAPCFQEKKLLKDMISHVQNGKSRLVYTKNLSPFPGATPTLATSMCSSLLSGDHVISHPAAFSFIMGKNLKKTEALMDGETFFKGTEEHELVRDFIAFFSLPLGDTQKTNSSNVKIKRYLNLLDGIVIIYRGNLNRFEDFLTKDGFNFKNLKALLRE